MPMFFGCMSSKNASSAEKKVKTKAEKRSKKKGAAIQNGGDGTENPPHSEAKTDPTPPLRDASLSQVNVTAATTAADEPSSDKRNSFIPRPLTIVNEGSLITEIVSALDSPTTESEKPSEEKKNGSPKPSQHTPAPPSVVTEPTPAITTPTSETKETDAAQDPEEAPPTPPPRPKPLSQTLTASSDATTEAPNPDDEPPPTLPPKPALPMTEKPAVDAKNAEQDEAPPMLPPRCIPPSPPRVSTGSMSSAPQKPRRLSTDSNMEEGLIVRKSKPASFREPPPLPDDWAIIDLPKTDAELLRLTRKPEQLATIASQYVVKHISFHTDVRVTEELREQIYTAFLQVAKQHRGILQRFLTDLIEDQANSSGGDGQPAEPSHGAVIVLIGEILRQFVKADSVVAVSLEVLRAVSGVSGVTQSLVECEVTGAMLDMMSAHKSSATVQCSCLVVLGRIASFVPTVHQKIPLDQLATDLICLSLETFPKSSAVVQAGCHVLSTLVNTLFKAVSAAVDKENGQSEEQDKFLTGLLALMDYIFSKNLPAVRSALKCHAQDPAVMSDGRQFLVIYSQLEQLRQRKKQRLNGNAPSDTPPPLPAKQQARRSFDQILDSAPKEEVTSHQMDTKESHPQFNHKLEYENWDLLRGVLKKKSTLRGHSYSKADLNFMQQLMKTQVVALVCALAVDGHLQDALQLLDQPVADIVLTTEVPPGVRDFVAHLCTVRDTLIDLDAGLFVSLIDAVRYPSLSFKMAQKNVLKVASSLDGEQQMAVVAVTVEFLASTITNRPLAPAMTVPEFVKEVCSELERAMVVSKNRGALESLLSEIRQCARKTTHSN